MYLIHGWRIIKLDICTCIIWRQCARSKWDHAAIGLHWKFQFSLYLLNILLMQQSCYDVYYLLVNNRCEFFCFARFMLKLDLGDINSILWIALFSSVPIFVKLRKKTSSSVRKFVISGLPEHSLSQGYLSQE